MDFKPVKLEEYCPTITYDFKFIHLRDTQLFDVLVISFHGTYRDGSAGSPDAGFIKGIITTGLAVFRPFSVLIDMSDLEYNWGDNLDLSFAETEYTDTVVVVSEKCRRAMSTLLFGLDTDKDIVDNDFSSTILRKQLKSYKTRLSKPIIHHATQTHRKISQLQIPKS